jgi:ATP-dependent RNA circularization protein (DNA/RNA ligase family)
MSDGFFRFPHTPHLAWLGQAEPRDDKVLSSEEAVELLSGLVVLEEKLDGANLGFSLSPEGELRAQNRGQYLAEPHAGQFARLPAWLALHGSAIGDTLLEHADQRLMLFGEWCAARHSMDYARLPDWFLLFDVLETSTNRFWSSTRRDALAANLGLATPPHIASGRFKLAELTAKVESCPSRFRDGPLEGIVVRRESAQWCQSRAKLVRADFTQAIGEHWRNRRLEWNRLAAPWPENKATTKAP